MRMPPLEPGSDVPPAGEFGTTSQLLADVGRGHAPVAVMLTCWDLGSAPQQVSRALPGEILIVQNPGGLVPPAVAPQGGASLDSVICGLKHATVRHLIVCGHTRCGTLGLLLADEKNTELRQRLLPVHDRLRAACRGRRCDPLPWVVQQVILQQLANLRSHAWIQSRLQKHEVFLHGWMRDDKTSRIKTYHPASGQFRAAGPAQSR